MLCKSFKLLFITITFIFALSHITVVDALGGVTNIIRYYTGL